MKIVEREMITGLIPPANAARVWAMSTRDCKRFAVRRSA